MHLSEGTLLPVILETANIHAAAFLRSGAITWISHTSSDEGRGASLDTLENWLGPAAAANVLDTLSRLAEGEASVRFQNEAFGVDDWFEFTVTTISDEVDGQETFLVTLVDVTADVHRERRLRALLREVSHRSRNLLSVIIAVANLTARKAPNVETFLRRFSGRIFSMARSQDLITDSSWRGAHLSAVIRGQAEKILGDERDAVIHVEGADPMLTPNQAMHVGLAIHELIIDAATQAAQNGIDPEARVITDVVDENGSAMIVLRWVEPSQLIDLQQWRDTASPVLDRIVPQAMSGTASWMEDNGLVAYVLRFPEASRDSNTLDL